MTVPVPATSPGSNAMTLAQQQQLPMTELIGTVEQLQAAGQTEAALDLYRHWLAHNPSPLAYAIWFNLGVALVNAGLPAQARDAYQNAIAQNERFLPARFNLGTSLEKLGQADLAISTWQDILALDATVLAADVTTHTLTLNNLGRLLEIGRQYPQAEACLRQSLVLSLQHRAASNAAAETLLGDLADVTQHWLHLRQKQCRWPLLADWPGAQPESALLAASTLSTLALTDDPQTQLATARRFLQSRIQRAAAPLAQKLSYGHPRLRIGYLSGDFCCHPLSLLMVELFEQHDRTQFEIYGYCWSPEDGSMLRQRVIHAMEHFTRIDTRDDTAAAQRIRADEIDILVDLQGLTSGFRPRLLALRPAPIQITYLGFPGSSGHPDIDYLIADQHVIPPEQAPHYSETVLYMPRCFQPSDRQREVAAPLTRAQCGLPEQAFVFCCFNNNYKITPEVFACWMRILAQVPASVLWLLADNPWARTHLTQAAGQSGIDPDRLIFSERTAPAQYLMRYPLADLFLDTFPFNAGTTANDALWMGLPLLTLSGRAFASRMAGSLLHTLGLPELITTDLPAFEARAVELALAPEPLATLRQQLAAARQSSALFDIPQFARDFEALLAGVAQLPAHIPVSSRQKDAQQPEATRQPTGSETCALPIGVRAGMAAELLEDRLDSQPIAPRKCFLHVGCGGQRQAGTLPVFNDGHWNEIRQDIDPGAQPDILGSMTDLGALADAAVDAVYSSHNIEHLYPHDVPLALREFWRVLKPEGFVIITCPDLQSVCAQVAANRLLEPAYMSSAGPIAPLDILYGLRSALAQGHSGMAHRTGFTRDSLQTALQTAGFATVAVIARPDQFALWAVACKRVRHPGKFTELKYIPQGLYAQA